MSLRERKKLQTRQNVIAVAERLFEERGYDNVTVAEIADAADISVKTLFVYFRSKEDLAFADTSLIDDVASAIERRGDKSHAEALVESLLTRTDDTAGLEAFHRGYGQSAALESGLLRMWAAWEERLVAALAAEADGPATPRMRLHAIALVGIIRTTTSPELLDAVSGLTDSEAQRVAEDWLAEAAAHVEP
ncbi:TetR/AcrR family transcriptional regulator [Rhodococcoides yunnanense]|uniref:TetR/AcrR family transcriptional regulator n=1 Tax=Rhodococcoides yunnanense TaxID=278209 RepID=UPI00093490DC|nr:TetR/AcrR family transcriptional regulator [Rhodococcus yunnanensis]